MRGGARRRSAVGLGKRAARGAPRLRRTWLAQLATVALTAALLVTLVQPRSLEAQEQAARTIGLDEALRIAEGSNPALRRATNDVDLNPTEMRGTWFDQLLPSATLQLSTSFTGNLQRVSTDNFGNPIANPAADWAYFSGTTQRLNLGWQVQGPSLLYTHRRQSLVNEGRDLARTRALTDVQVQVQLLYMDALEQRELMESEAELVESRRIDLDVAERLFAMALRTRVDVLNAELAVEQQALVLQRQRAAYETALLDLQSELGADDEGPIRLVEEPLPVFDPSALRADALVDRALSVNPSLRESDVTLQAVGLDLAERRSSWWPSLSMGITVFRREQASAGGGLFDPAFDRGLESNFFVGLEVPAFNNFFGDRTDRQRATVALRNQQETDREARLEIEKAVRGAVLTLGNEWETLRLAERLREISEEALRLAREQYRLGAASFEDLRATFVSQAESRRQVITARHGFVEALLRLEEAVGSPVRPTSAPGGQAPAAR